MHIRIVEMFGYHDSHKFISVSRQDETNNTSEMIVMPTDVYESSSGTRHTSVWPARPHGSVEMYEERRNQSIQIYPEQYNKE